MATADTTFDVLLRNLHQRKFLPVYYLMGEEDYFIDCIANYLVEHVMPQEQREFNQMVLYGNETTMGAVVTAAMRYPMMSDWQLIVVKEAQNLKDGLDSLAAYLQHPTPTTILVFCHKHGVIDRRKKVSAQIDKLGVLFESKRLREAQLPHFINNYLKARKATIDAKAAELLADHVGTDLSRLASELDKLLIAVGGETPHILPEHIEQNIGISKDFNNFELRAALVNRDVYKANRIIRYFEQNPKSNPIQVTLATLFSFFANLMMAYYAPSRTDRDVAAFLGLRNTWQATEYITAMRHYSGKKVFEIIGLIRTCDAMSKGHNNRSIPASDLLRELIFKILH